MLSKIEHLSSAEKNLIVNAPVLISALVSGSDGEFTPSEIQQAVKIIHIKTYSETRDVSGVYKTVDGHTEESIEMLISALPESTRERNDMLISMLIGLNEIFPKLETNFAHELYSSLKELAYYVSNAGDLGIGIRTDQEKEMAQLSFLNAPGA